MRLSGFTRYVAAFATITLFTLLLVSGVAAARETAASPALWKIDGEKGDIYFFGSFHILPKDLVWRTPALEAALAAAQQLDFEVDLDQAQNPAIMGDLVARYGFLPPDKSLRKMIAVEYRARLEAVTTELGLPIASVDRMRPWLAALTITSLTALKQTQTRGGKPDPSASVNEQEGADLQLWNWAKANDKARGALETVESQIRIFSDLTPDQEIQYLIVTLQQVNRLKEDLETLLRAWQAGDLKRLDKELNGDTDHFPQMRDALMTQRHAKWIPQIERMLADGRTHVVIVGAAHLVGKGSVIDLLRSKGLKVEGP